VILRRHRRALVLAALLLVAGSFALLLFTQRPYRVVGRSMEPALVEGDWLRLARTEPQAGDVVVFREPDSGSLAVKRVAATPGEIVQIVGADVWVDGAVRARPLSDVEDLVPMLDAAGSAVQEDFDLAAAGFEPDTDCWRLQEGSAQSFLRRPPLASYLLREEPVTQAQEAGELGLEVEYALLAPGSELHLHLRLGRTTFSAVLADGGRRVQLTSRTAETGPEVLHEGILDVAEAHGRFFLSIVDRRLTLILNGRRLVEGLSYEQPEPLLLADGPASIGLRTHAGLGGVGPLEVRRVRLGRDVLYDPSGTYGGSQGFHLGPDEYFVLGDNPPSSRDSRQYGAVAGDRILGVVRGRIWPGGWTARGWPID
jgi:signal peptidase I